MSLPTTLTSEKCTYVRFYVSMVSKRYLTSEFNYFITISWVGQIIGLALLLPYGGPEEASSVSKMEIMFVSTEEPHF